MGGGEDGGKDGVEATTTKKTQAEEMGCVGLKEGEETGNREKV